jgi:hypothetical protein
MFRTRAGSLLRRLPRALGAALLATRAPLLVKSIIAVAIVVAALAASAVAFADGTAPPPTTPTTTTPDAPLPDPYKPPAAAPKPKAAPSHSAPRVVRSAPVVSTRTYSPPVSTVAPRYTAPVSTPRPHRVAKVTHKPRRHVVRHGKKAKPVPVTQLLAPAKQVLAAARIPVPSLADDSGSRDRYLWLAGLAFALLAVAGLSVHFLSARVLGVGVR